MNGHSARDTRRPKNVRVDRSDAITHIARNVSATDNVELWAAYLVHGDPGMGFRIDVSPAPSSC